MTLKPRKRWHIPAALAVLIILFITLIPRQEGPIYRGRHLSEWVDLKGRSKSGASVAADEAVQEAGTNAFPFLLNWMQHEDTGIRYRMFKPLRPILSAKQFNDLTQSPAEHRANEAMRMFFLLRTNLGPGEIRELSRLANDDSAPQTAVRATTILAGIGPKGMPSVAEVLYSGATEVREVAVAMLYIQDMKLELTPSAKLCAPGLIGFVTSSNRPSLVMFGKTLLTNINITPDEYVPTLTSSLTNSDASIRRCAATVLANFGAKARSAAPALQQLLNDPAPEVRNTATAVLRLIVPEALTNAPPQ